VYTIRIDNYDDYDSEMSEGSKKKFCDDFSLKLREKLEPHAIDAAGIFPYPTTDETFMLVNVRLMEPRVRPGRKVADTLLSTDDWKAVNDCVNEICDEYNFCALIRSSKIIIREGKKRKV
jgi:hypothetical protein